MTRPDELELTHASAPRFYVGDEGLNWRGRAWAISLLPTKPFLRVPALNPQPVFLWLFGLLATDVPSMPLLSPLRHPEAAAKTLMTPLAVSPLLLLSVLSVP